jgi:myo-inositol 2-dehydrogenase / D-chiro-inositol 1-dehydrogenase
MTADPLGVGFVGAGPVTQAIHLPTLARLTELFTVTHVTDIADEIAASVAARVGARSSTSIGELLDDPRVDVVAVCSPHQFHAAQVIAACRAGKKAVLCEKPFAMSADEAAEIAAVSAETKVPIIVGAMHAFDPGWRDAVAHWNDLPATSHTLRSSIVLPPNPRFEDFATEVITRPDPSPADFDDVEVQAAFVHAGVMGLAIHDLPLVRALLNRFDDLAVLSAHALQPFGYQIVLTVGGKLVELHAAMTATWRPEWVLEAFSDDQSLRVEFSPSYVHAGSGVSTHRSGGRAATFGPAPSNGYEGEWREIHGIVHGHRAPPEMSTLIDDLSFALTLAAAAAASVRSSRPMEVSA